MSPKNKTQTIPHEDSYKRINFLYQAAYKCLESSPSDLSLCRYYVYSLRTIAKRLMLHMSPSLKRSMCRRCCVLLIPGVTAMYRDRNKRQKHTVVTCLECGSLKRYVGIPGKVPWIDREESWQESITNGVLVHKPQPNQQNKKKNKGKQSNNQEPKQTSSTKISSDTQTDTKSTEAMQT